MSIRSAILLGAEQVIAIDCVPERLSMAEAAGAIAINFMEESVVERLNDLTHGKGPDKCIDATGMESHVSISQPDTLLDRAKQMLMLENDRPHVLREMIYVCRPAGDALDLVTLASFTGRGNPRRANVSTAIYMVLGITILDLFASQATASRHRRGRDNDRHAYRDRSGFPQGLQAARGAARVQHRAASARVPAELGGA